MRGLRCLVFTTVFAGAEPWALAQSATEAESPETPATAPGGITADQVGERAMRTSYQAKAGESLARAASARADQALAAFLPRVGATARYARLSDFTPEALTVTLPGPGGSIVGTPAAPGTLNPTPTAALAIPSIIIPLVLDQYLLQATVSIPLSDYFLRIASAYSAATSAADAAGFDVIAAKAKSLSDGKIAYYSWLRARGASLVTRQALAAARGHFKDAETAFKAGNASKADVMRAQTAVSSSEVAVLRSNSAVVITEHEIRLAMHTHGDERLEPGESLERALPSPPHDLSELVSEAQTHRAELKSLERSAKALHHQASATRGAGFPSLSVFADAMEANPNPRRFPPQAEWFPTWSIGAQVTWAPTDIFGVAAGAADAEARASALEAQKGAVRDGVDREVTQTYQLVLEADAAILATARQLESATEGSRVARQLFVTGRGTSVALLDAESVLTQSRFESLNAKVDARIARVRLDHALGRDTPPPAGGASAVPGDEP